MECREPIPVAQRLSRLPASSCKHFIARCVSAQLGQLIELLGESTPPQPPPFFQFLWVRSAKAKVRVAGKRRHSGQSPLAALTDKQVLRTPSGHYPLRVAALAKPVPGPDTPIAPLTPMAKFASGHRPKPIATASRLMRLPRSQIGQPRRCMLLIDPISRLAEFAFFKKRQSRSSLSVLGGAFVKNFKKVNEGLLFCLSRFKYK